MPTTSIAGLPEYIGFSYRFNYTTVFLIVSTVYSIPPLVIVIVMIRFFFKNYQNHVPRNVLRVDVFALFLLMQSLAMINVLLDIIVVRLPATSILTSFCASQNPERLLNISFFLLITALFYANFITVLFCLLRVFILFSSSFGQKTRLKPMFFIVFLCLVLSALFAYLRYIHPTVCAQMTDPLPFGSIELVTEPREDTWALYPFIESSVYPCILVALLSLTLLTSLKVRRKRLFL
ncbi:unnamed protein product [Caenorhabditis sp. 36 PRJEB53466]|nr:unnamed protein product [Caenorhabditis sp. 36 PRJEB53466]